MTTGEGVSEGGALPPRGRLLRKYALTLAALVAGALVVAGAVETWFSANEYQEALVRIQREKAAVAAQAIEQFVAGIEGQLGWTTHASAFAGPNGAERRRFDFIRLLRQAPPITGLTYIDGDGKEQLRISRVALDVVGSGIDRSNEPSFTEAKAQGVWHGPVYFQKELEPYMAIAAAERGRNGGVTVAEVNLKFIWDVVSGIEVGRTGRAYVVDGNGRLIAHPDISLVLRRTDLGDLPQVAAALAGGMPGKPVVAPDPEGREALSTYARIAPLGWLVFVDLPVAEAYQPLYASMLRTGGLVLSGVLLATLVGFMLARRMTGPIQRLQQGAARIGGGDLADRIEIKTGDELEALAGEFNRMAGRLHESYTTLEQKVEARTQELREALERQTATSEVLNVISRSTSELQPVLDAIVATAARLCQAEWATIRKLESDGRYHLAASSATEGEFIRYLAQNPIVPGRGTITGRTALEGRTVHVPDVLEDPEFTWFGAQAKGKQRTVLGVPLLRANAVIGVIVLLRNIVRPFTDKQIELVTTFADQAVIAIENVRLFDEVNARTTELTEALERQTATSDVLTVISRSTSELQPVLDTIVTTAARLCHAEWATVYKLEAGGVYRLVAAIGDDEEFLHYLSQRPIIPERGTMAGRTALEGRTLHVPDILEDPDYTWSEAQAKGRYRTLLGVPLLRAGAVIGVIVLARNIVKPFTEKQIELVTTFADQAVIAIENVRLFDEVNARTAELTESLRQQTATADVLKVISRSAFDLEAVLHTLIASAARLCDADKAVITRQIGGRFYDAEACGFSPEFMEYVRNIPVEPERGSAAGRALLEGKVVHIADVEADPEYTFLEGKKLGGFRTVLGVPMLRKGIPIGVMSLTRSDVRPFTDRQIELVSTFADQAVIAIENVRLFDEVQARTRELTRSVAELRALSEVSQAVNSTLELGAVLNAIAAHAVALAEADAGAFYAYDESARVFRLRATHELDPEVVEAITRRPVRLGEGAVGAAGLRRAAVQIPDIDQEAGYALHDIIRKPGYRALLAVPLLREDSLVGGLVICRKTPGAFAAETVDLVQTLANQSVLAIENARLFEALEQKGRELAEASRHKSEFLANMSHELRTPLNAIIGFTRLVMRRAKDVLPAKQHDNLGKILTSAEHLLSLINTVLDLAKIEAGRIEVRPSAFALEPLIDQCLRTVEPMARDGVRLAKAVEPDLPELDTDQEKVRQILLNLLGNAAKFTDSGSISVGARHRDGQIALEVADTGCGIPPESLDLIFEEFRQVDSSSTRQHGGTGLGLSISRHLARLIGGDIDLASTVDVGSTFTLTFPARYEPPAAAPSLAASEAAGEVARTDRNRCILAIDDDPDTIYLLRENLAEAGYEVIVASDGEDGLRKARQHRPGAVVLDILMPQKDGWQVLHQLKADPETRDIPIIVLSIVDQKDLGFRLGASDYLLKPPDRDALIGALRRVAAPPCRLLVADDDPLVPDLIRQLLEDLGCEIEAAGDGRAALAMLAKRRPDVLLLDLLMPNLDGFGVLEQLAQNPALAGLPVIVLTAKTLTSDERALLQRRVLAIIEKRGLDRATLLEEVRRALPACGGAQEAEGSTDAEDPDRGRRGAEPRPARAAS